MIKHIHVFPLIAEQQITNQTNTQNPDTALDTNKETQLESINSAEPRISTQSGLTQFEDTVGFEYHDMVGDEIDQDYNPYPGSNIELILSRTYPLTPVSWTSSQLRGTIIAEITLPDVAINIPALKQKLATYEFLRSDFEVSFRLNSTITHYGSVMVAVVPMNSSILTLDSSVAVNVYTMSMYPHIILNANEPETQTLHIPYYNAKDYWTLNDSFPNLERTRIVLMVLNTLKNAQDTCTPPINIQTYVRFVKPRVAGYVSEIINVEQMEMVNKTLGMFRKQSPPQERTLGPQRNNQAPDREQREKSKDGTMARVAKGVSSVAKGFKSVPIVGGVAHGVSMVSDVLGWVFDKMGLEQPPDTRALDRAFVFNYPLTNYARGLSSYPRLNIDPETQAPTDPRIFNHTKTDEMLVNTICRTPTLLLNADYDASDAADYEVARIPVTPMYMREYATRPGYVYYYPTFVGGMSTYARYWNGSLKYLIQVDCAKTMSSRLRLTYLPNNAEDYSNVGEMVSKVVDITGTTLVSLTIPYLSNYNYLETDMDDTLGTLLITIENPIVNNTCVTSTTAYVNVWVAGGEDFRLYVPTGAPANLVVTHDVPEEEGEELINKEQFNPREMFDTTFEPLAPGNFVVRADHNFGEEFVNIKDILLRPKYMGLMSRNSANEYDVTPDDISSCTRFFKFLRMSQRMTLDPTEPSRVELGDTQFVYSNPISLYYNKETPMIFEVPYISKYYFSIHRYGSYAGDWRPRGRAKSTMTQAYVTVAAGDDTILGFLHFPGLFRYPDDSLFKTKKPEEVDPVEEPKVAEELSAKYFANHSNNDDWSDLNSDEFESIRQYLRTDKEKLIETLENLKEQKKKKKVKFKDDDKIVNKVKPNVNSKQNVNSKIQKETLFDESKK